MRIVKYVAMTGVLLHIAIPIFLLSISLNSTNQFNLYVTIFAIFISLIGYLACTLMLVAGKFKEKWFVQFMIIVSAFWLIFPPAFAFSLINITYIGRNWNRLVKT